MNYPTLVVKGDHQLKNNFINSSFNFSMNEGMGIIERIMEWIVKNRIFVRERKSNAERALGMLLYHAGLSYNKAAIFVNASYEAVRKWY